MLWTTHAAAVFVFVVLRFKKSLTLRLRAKPTTLDWLPCNGDLYVLPTVPKLIFTIIRVAVIVLAAVGTLGIDPGVVYTQEQGSTHVVSATNENFTGRAYNSSATESLQDFAVVACEDVTTTSIVKFMAFLSDTNFSCNFGREVGQKKLIAEVIWHQDTVREISKGHVLPVDIALGEKSAMLMEESDADFVRLRDSTGAPVFMSVVRRSLQNSTYGECDPDSENDAQHSREYLVLSNGVLDQVGDIEDHIVSVAYVVCKGSSVVSLRDTDRMMFLPHINGAQQMIMARQVAEAIISITEDSSQQVYLGRTRRVTKVNHPFYELLLALTIVNVTLLVVSVGGSKYVKRDFHLDVFSPVSMYWVGHALGRKEENAHKKITEDVLIFSQYTDDRIEISEKHPRLDPTGIYMV